MLKKTENQIKALCLATTSLAFSISFFADPRYQGITDLSSRVDASVLTTICTISGGLVATLIALVFEPYADEANKKSMLDIVSPKYVTFGIAAVFFLGRLQGIILRDKI